MENKTNDYGPPQNKLGYKLLVNCLKEHGNEIASKINQMRDKDEAEEGNQVFESVGQNMPEDMKSKERVQHKFASFPSAINKELFSKIKGLNKTEEM